ncbi:MAG TPA: hypothetical protein VGE12_16235 [Noviherbaspirillum sp.]
MPAPAQRPAATAPPDGEGESWWDSPWFIAPRMGWFGYAGYEWHRNTFEESDSVSRGMVAMLGGRLQSYLWQPWFGQLRGEMRMRMGRDNADLVNGDENKTMSSKNLSVTGNAKLNLFHRSRFPFEAHFDRDYSRSAAGDQPDASGYISQRFGFTQTYKGLEGFDGTLAWEHGTQTARYAGKTSQDALQLTMAYKLSDISNIGVSGTRSTTSQKSTGQRSLQHNLSVTHNYVPDPTISIDTTANINASDYRMNPGDNQNRLLQLNTVGFWRPEEEPLTVTASARVLGLAAENTAFEFSNGGFVPIHAEARMRTGNLSAGATYNLSDTTTASANINAGFMHVNGERRLTYSENAGITYSPEEIQLGEFQYRWNAGANASHQGSDSGGGNGAQLALQLSHNLSRRFRFDDDSMFTINASQGMGYAMRSNVPPGMPSAGMQVTHSASASWNAASSGGTGAMVMLGASDSRSLDGDKQFFQMVNLQLSGNMSFGGNSSLQGNLSIQATRQSVSNLFLTPGTVGLPGTNTGDFTTTSNGSITYRNQRLFGVRRLVLTSDLRLTSQALLPMLGGPLDQEMAAWDTRIEYGIGLTIVRMHTLIARTIVPNYRALLNGGEPTEPETKVNKSIMFSVTRAFGG